MNTPRRRPRAPKPPKLAASPPRTTELIGLTDDGRMVLWSTGQVQPIDRFETGENGRWIESGHYVINWKGHAITVHCGNMMDGNVDVQFMCNAGSSQSFPRTEVETLLIGKVIRDEEARRQIMEAFAVLEEAMRHRHREPHLQRGRIQTRG
jgi:hypothetical protein